MSDSVLERLAHKINTQLACFECSKNHTRAKKYLDIITSFHVSIKSKSSISNFTSSLIEDIECKNLDDSIFWNSIRNHLMKILLDIQYINTDNEYLEVGKFLQQANIDLQNRIKKAKKDQSESSEIKFEDFLYKKLDCQTDRLYKPGDQIPQNLHNAEDIELKNPCNKISPDKIGKIIIEYLEKHSYKKINECLPNFFSGEKNKHTKMINFTYSDERVMISVQIF